MAIFFVFCSDNSECFSDLLTCSDGPEFICMNGIKVLFNYNSLRIHLGILSIQGGRRSFPLQYLFLVALPKSTQSTRPSPTTPCITMWPVVASPTTQHCPVRAKMSGTRVPCTVAARSRLRFGLAWNWFAPVKLVTRKGLSANQCKLHIPPYWSPRGFANPQRPSLQP